MVETDWKKILSFSQRELTHTDKEKLCESLCWMEADDIELNFTDLKTLFRLAQDILKLKSEQVNNLVGQLKTTPRKSTKTKIESPYAASPTQSNDSALETITHQEEIIRANKEILEQLYADIADLESKKNKLEESKSNVDFDSESSRDVLSEMNAVAELEREVTMKNKHIRKLLNNVKVLEDQNTKLKEKATVLKEKLTEATQLINNFTEQIVTVNNECRQLKEILGKTEQQKIQMTIEIDDLRKQLNARDSNKENIYDEIKSKLQHWKNMAKSKKAEIEALSNENLRLKEDLRQLSKISPPTTLSLKNNNEEQLKIKELQDKLLEAAAEIEKTANIIEMLRAENKQLKIVIEEVPDFSMSETKNESDDGKERTIIKKLRKKVAVLTFNLQMAEEIIEAREKELAELTSQLQLLRSNEGINALLEGLKSKKRELKFKEEGIKSLVVETNTLNQHINDLQLENESLRQKYNIPSLEKISTKGVIKDYYNLKSMNAMMCKKLNKLENKLIGVELINRDLQSQLLNLSKFLSKQGHAKTTIEEIARADNSQNIMITHDDVDEKPPPSVIENRATNIQTKTTKDDEYHQKEMVVLIEENKGLRQGLQEILDFLKENGTTSSDGLTLQCPSLEAILISMEARNSAGWFAPHMSTVLELRAALGGKDALFAALQEARKDTLNVVTELSEATKKTSQLEKKLSQMEQLKRQKEDDENLVESNSIDVCEFGSWISENNQTNLDFYDTSQIHSLIEKGNALYECQLKKGLEYFRKKFKDLYEKLTLMTIQTTDNYNKWSIQEEHLKAEIENLKSQLQHENEDVSDSSPGLILTHDGNFLERKCLYLEELYRHIRTLNENLKNEILENKKNEMLASSEYENQIQSLMLNVINLIEKLRGSVSYHLFWKQNVALNEANSKYRKLVEENISNQDTALDILKHLEDDKLDILNRIHQECMSENGTLSIDEANTERIILDKQKLRLISELDLKTKEINKLIEIVAELQQVQGQLIDNNIASITKEEENFLREQIHNLTEDSKILKEKCQHVSNQLDIALMQLQDSQQRQVSYDMEINMLHHQILDLQSTSDNKAIIARLSGEILIAHLQTSECQKTIERLSLTLSKEKEAREDTEQMMRTRQQLFDVYTLRHKKKIRYIYDVLQILRQQYQGCIPRASIEKYLNRIEDFNRKNHAVDEKLTEIEELRLSLITKHSIFDQILDISKGKCLVDENSCPHKLKYIMTQSINTRELEHIKKKINILEQSREKLIEDCNYLEKTLVLVNQGFEKQATRDNLRKMKEDNKNKKEVDGDNNIELEDIYSDAESSSSHKNLTITLTKGEMLQQHETSIKPKNVIPNIIEAFVENKIPSPKPTTTTTHASAQTVDTQKINKLIQTDEYHEIFEMKAHIGTLESNINKKSKELSEAMALIQTRSEEILNLNKEKIRFEHTVKSLNDSNSRLANTNEGLRLTIDELKKQFQEIKVTQTSESNKIKDSVNEENKSLLLVIKELENDKNSTASEYKGLLNSEREEYAKSMKELHLQITELQSKLHRHESESSESSEEALKEVITKYTMKITELQDKCFKLQSDLDNCKTMLSTYQTEAERWKDLAAERLTKMEQLSLQLEERHCHEVESYKAENQHWLSQLNDTQQEHLELRTRLIDQKTAYIKQLADKDTQMEQLRVVINNLKAQIMNMQTLISVNDPSFDLSAIVEIDETSDVLSQRGSDRLELKFDSSLDLHESQGEIIRIPASSTTIWQEPVIERLRREKQLSGKQNAILRRQIKVLASRERRARLDAQNLKNQVFRISTSGHKVTTAETAALHNKISSLQAQLTSARRDTHSSIALWDKWKRAQQAADRWQARYEDRCQEVVKLEASLHLAKSAVGRLDKEKRILLSRLNEIKNENHLISLEKQDAESPEKSHRSGKECVYDTSPLPVSSQALLDRVQAQQRRIAALEFAEKGNELLVSEYERALAEITSLKGQVLKLESTLLESQIRMPLKSVNDTQPELEYWKNYCEMLKEENVQLTQKINSIETLPTTAHQHRVSDLEKTVLTLRAVVNKLQSEQKSGSTIKRIDSRPSSSRSGMEKGRIQLDSHRIEIVNLKRTILDKDLLLEKSKEMLKIAAEREEELLKENAYLRQQLEELTKPKGGFLSA